MPDRRSTVELFHASGAHWLGLPARSTRSHARNSAQGGFSAGLVLSTHPGLGVSTDSERRHHEHQLPFYLLRACATLPNISSSSNNFMFNELLILAVIARLVTILDVKLNLTFSLLHHVDLHLRDSVATRNPVYRKNPPSRRRLKYI